MLTIIEELQKDSKEQNYLLLGEILLSDCMFHCNNSV